FVFAADDIEAAAAIQHGPFHTLLLAADNAAGERGMYSGGATDDEGERGREEFDGVGFAHVSRSAFTDGNARRSAAHHTERAAQVADLPGGAELAAEGEEDVLLERVGLLVEEPFAGRARLGDGGDEADGLAGAELTKGAVEAALEGAALEAAGDAGEAADG